MKNLKKKIRLVYLIILFTFLFNLSSTLALTCTLRNVGYTNPCPGSETCVFSMYQETDSHVGDCNYGNWKVCCEEPGGTLTTTVKTTACDPNLNEVGVISLYTTSDSHVERYKQTNYPYHICLSSSLGKLELTYSTSCNPAETLASLQSNTNSHAARYDQYLTKICGISPFKFKMWIDESRLFTIGRPERVNIYVQNLGAESDSYNITYSKNATMNLNPADHLIDVDMSSSRIHSVEPDRVGNTFATITILGPIDSGNVNFTIRSDSNPSAYMTGSIYITADVPISLPEFGLIGLVELILLACLILVISYSSHLCKSFFNRR